MATYVISDIHGMYDKFLKMLDKLGFNDDDTLYVLGDVLDRGPNPIKVLQKMMEMPNVIPIVGNHELMAMECLDFLVEEITRVGVAGKQILISHCRNLKDAEALKAALEAAFSGIEVLIQEARGLDSFYAERSGLIVGY